MRVLVCGGRSYTDRQRVFAELDKLATEDGRYVMPNPWIEIIHGGAKGADALAGEWARERHRDEAIYRADWKKHGLAAGPRRNAQMLSDGRPDLVLAFPGGKGTADMVRQAREASVEVREITA